MLTVLLWFLNAGANAELRVPLSNIAQKKGHLYVAVYDREADFLSTVKMRDRKIVPVTQTGTVQISFPDLPPGRYAISCFHDVNDNGKLDTNMFGIPTEPYGFSNNTRPKFRAPYWSEAHFYMNTGGETQAIRLEKW